MAQDIDCMSYSEASQDPSQAKCLYMDCRLDDCNDFFAQIEQYSNLNSLEIANLNRDNFPRDLSNFKELQTITFTQCPGINYNSLIRKLATLPGLKKLVFDNDGLTVIPKSIPLLAGLYHLVIRNNENFDVERSIALISHLQNLKNLSLPVNQISDLPENIGMLDHLEMLDLSDNQLTDLPNNVKNMDSLEVLNIEKNVLINPLQTLEKLKGLNIRYVSMDVSLNDKDREKLKKIFPKAEIREVVDTSSVEDDSFPDDYFGLDSLGTDTSELEYRTILVDGAKFQVLSDAYLHYPAIFERENFKSTFDSLLFEERYLDTNYCNTWKMQPWRTYNNIRLYLFKDGVKGQIWFDFHPYDKKNDVPSAEPYIAKNNPELMVFLGMKWVYQGELTLSQFKKKYIKSSSGYRYWCDARVYFSERDKSFIIELKDKHGFTQISAYLRSRSRSISLEKTQESYESYFEKYTKALDNRRKRFHKKLMKDKSAYDLTLERSFVSAWEIFRKMYMSPEEQRMSMKNWLEYYDKVLADEKSALKNAAPSAGLLERHLVLFGYHDATNDALNSDTTQMKGIYTMFRDDSQNMVAVVKLMLVNMSDHSFRSFEGSLGLKNIRLYISNNTKYAIIAQLRNGDIGILSPEAFMQLKLYQNKEYIFALKRLPRKLSSIGQIQDLIGY
jgi:hypothetical protein